MKAMSTMAQRFIALIAATGIACIGFGAFHWQSSDYVKFLCYLAVALAASGMKVTLPGVNGTMSVSFLFIFLGVVDLGFSETLTIACLANLVQSFWRLKRHPNPVHVVFNVCTTAMATTAAYAVYHVADSALQHGRPLLLLAAAAAYFVANTVPIAVIISLTEGKTLKQTWVDCYSWSFPYFLVGASISGLVRWMNHVVPWQTSLLVLPVVYFIYRSYRLYIGKLETEKLHVEDMASLHLRTIEALALAIEAKDQTTHDHLQRVCVYALELGKDLGLNNDEMEALKAAALLHDIGKLAVPEHIISKPGRLTPEEFEKMKIHPTVGAEILEQVHFPYPVVPIVRAHHEKWDGSGYPDGLSGEQIPIGARILAAVDCLDALASDRQYRRALPLDEAMKKVVADSGKHFDPRVVQILEARYTELEHLAREQGEEIRRAKLSTDIKVERGAAPAAGFANEGDKAETVVPQRDFLSSIAAARQEVQLLSELSHDLGTSLSLDETLSVLSVRLKRLVSYDSIAIYIHKDDKLIPEFVSGDNFRLFASLEIPLGQGLSGWVGQNCKPIINGNPSVEPGYLNDPDRFSTLGSAMAVPLEGLSGVVGVLTLYRAEMDAFTQDNLRILLAISSKLAMVIENAMKFRQAESSAATDYLTGLPNARSLFVHLDRELARCKRSGETLGVLVCDLDGFKQVNDRFGHLEGNKVLREFASRLKDACREYDYVARMGGDEFVVVAPGMRDQDATEKIKRLQRLTEDLGSELFGESVLSVSIGDAYYDRDNHHDADQLLTDADRCMYKVKQEHQTLLSPKRMYTQRLVAAPPARGEAVCTTS
jgi:diguanylate cyclase (GGDEF)-like protein/putative nucleotidyltransferase with HDIG domain